MNNDGGASKPKSFHQLSLSDEQGQPSAPRRIAWWQFVALLVLVAVGVVAGLLGQERLVKFVEYAIGVLGTGTGAALLWAQVKSAFALYAREQSKSATPSNPPPQGDKANGSNPGTGSPTQTPT